MLDDKKKQSIVKDKQEKKLDQEYMPDMGDDVTDFEDEEYIGEKGGLSQDADLDIVDVDLEDDEEFMPDVDTGDDNLPVKDDEE